MTRMEASWLHRPSDVDAEDLGEDAPFFVDRLNLPHVPLPRDTTPIIPFRVEPPSYRESGLGAPRAAMLSLLLMFILGMAGWGLYYAWVLWSRP